KAFILPAWNPIDQTMGLAPCWLDYESDYPRIGCHPFFHPIFNRRVFGKIASRLALLVIAYEFLLTWFVLLPFETLFVSRWTSYFFTFLTLYFLVNVVFHYYAARFVSPGRPVYSRKAPICDQCRVHKPPNANHCMVCNQCFINKDHHCIWIDNCVAAGNLHHFYLLICFLAAGGWFWVLFSARAYVIHQFHTDDKLQFCNTTVAESSTAQFLCSISDNFVRNCIILTFVFNLLMTAHFTMMSLSYFLIISNQTTKLWMIKYGFPEKFTHLPYKRTDFNDVWKEFLGLRRGRTFWRHVLLPSVYKPNMPFLEEDESTNYEREPSEIVIDVQHH
uniref:Palmitoyltransferase n=1 Tax=Panagrolaimus sp. JU765 TaxID=591449 RepID=A0AC34QFC0_9BILA